MNNNDLIKTPATPYGDKTEKIEYQMHAKGAGEVFTLFFLFGFLILPYAIMLVYTIAMRDRITVEEDYNQWKMLAGHVSTLGFAALLIGLHIYFRKKRLKEIAVIQGIIAKGQMVIGDITNLKTTTSGSGDDSATNYYYHIKYRKPGSDKEVRFDTSYLLGNPQIRNDELPLKVKVYIGEGSYSYADEIINPPSEKIKSRKRFRLILITAMIVLAVGSIFVMYVNMATCGIMFVSAMAIGFIINLINRK